MLPLTLANAGETVTIRKITGKDDVRQRLAELGFVIGTELKVVSKIGGNLIAEIRGSRVALDSTMAARIMI